MSHNHQLSRRRFLQYTSLGALAATGLPGCLTAAVLPDTACSKPAQLGGFDRQLARLLLEICRYTYSQTFAETDLNEKKDADNALAWINKADKPLNIVPLSDGKGEHSTSVACVFLYPDKNIISYMGTKTDFNNIPDSIQSLADWDKNAKIKLVPFIMTNKQLGLENYQGDVVLEGQVHDGFFRELRAIQSQVIDVLMQNGGKSRDLYITGHSQGGAEAALATRAFSRGGFNIKAVYTFAAPRSCNQAAADAIPKNIPIYRLEFGNDIVPHVPTTHLAHQLSQDAIKRLTQLGLPSDHLNQFDAKHNLVGIGRLCYGNNSTQTLRINISDADERTLLESRLKTLMEHPKDWAENHHLAGTKAEVNAGKKGNYTALVSDFCYQLG